MRWPLPSIYPVTNDASAHVARGSGMAVDFAAPAGAPWLACADAVVKVNQHMPDAGHSVWIQWFDGPTDTLYRARYAHADRLGPLPVGAEVKAGDIIGWVGDTRTGQTGTATTGDHLHFALEKFTGVWERLDPELYLQASIVGTDRDPTEDTMDAAMRTELLRVADIFAGWATLRREMAAVVAAKGYGLSSSLDEREASELDGAVGSLRTIAG